MLIRFSGIFRNTTRNNAFTSMTVVDDSTATLIVSSAIDINVLKDSIQLTSSGGVTDYLLTKPHPKRA
jgi:hypothetical protein